MSLTITIQMTPDLRELITVLHGDVHEGIRAGMQNLLSEIEARAVKKAPIRTGNLVNSITNYIVNRGLAGVVKATAPYASYVHWGTGLYGPYKQKIVIRPRYKKALFWPGAAHPVKKVEQKGQKGKPFFLKAIREINPQKVFEEGIRNYLTRRRW